MSKEYDHRCHAFNKELTSVFYLNGLWKNAPKHELQFLEFTKHSCAALSKLE